MQLKGLYFFLVTSFRAGEEFESISKYSTGSSSFLQMFE